MKKTTIALLVLLQLSTFFFCTMWLLERKGAEGIKAELKWIHVIHVDDKLQLMNKYRQSLDECREKLQ